MSPRPADEGVRIALVEAAARLLAEEGPAALTTRRLAAEVGTSTMAVYTHFEDMDDLRRAVRVEGVNRFHAYLAGVRRTADPVADLAAQGWAYFSNAIDNPHMWRAMVVEPLPGGQIPDLWAQTFQLLVDAVQRCADEGRLRPGDPWERALQIWMTANGVLLACHGGLMPAEQAIEHMYVMTASLLAGYGDDADAAQRSLRRGRRRMERRGD